jgi:hypothetical protein
MLKVARLPGLAALFCLISAAAVHAQTVFITNAPQGTMLEFVLEGTSEGTAMANPMGNASVVANEAHLGTRQLDAIVLVDNCGTTRRVLVLDQNVQRPSPGTCARTEMNGVFLVQRITTLVVNVGNMPPTMLQRQGPPPSAWLQPTATGAVPKTPFRRYFVLSAGYGMLRFRDVGTVMCGNLNNCPTDVTSQSPTGAVSYWILPFVAAEASYSRFTELTAFATADTFNFDSNLEGGVFAFTGVGAIPLHKVKIFGKGGLTYHGATMTTNQTIVPDYATVDDVTMPIRGGTQTLQTHTTGTGWIWGGGVEVWLTKPVGVYGEIGRLLINGKQSGGDGSISDPVTYAFVGAKVRLPSFF